MAASPKHQYFAELGFDKPLKGIGSFVSYSNDDYDILVSTLQSEAKRYGVPCSARIWGKEDGKRVEVAKLKYRDLLGTPKTYREEIGEELQSLRVQRGLTVRELGDACGLAFTTISKIENGRYNVSVDILGKVAEALGYKLAFTRR